MAKENSHIVSLLTINMALADKFGQVLEHIGEAKMDEQPDKISDHQSRQYLLTRESVMKTYILRQYQSSEIEPMSKQAVFTMKLEPELRDEFMAEAEASHRPASQIVREMMRQFVQSQRESREYEEFLHRKVEVARASMHAGNGLSNDDVEAEFAARRARAAIEE